MAYCVRCGVELAPDLAACPLCSTRVLHPDLPPPLPPAAGEGAYPDLVEQAIARMDRGYARQLSLIITLIPSLIVLVLDLLDLGPLWSPYVIGALVLLWCFFAIPLVFPGKRPYLYVTVDALALLAYLALLAHLTDGWHWYLGVVMPVLVLVGLLTILLLWVIRRRQMVKLHRLALVLLLLAVFLLGLEAIIDQSAFAKISLVWSVYAAIPLMVIALMCLGLEHNKGLKEAIRKRLFV